MRTAIAVALAALVLVPVTGGTAQATQRYHGRHHHHGAHWKGSCTTRAEAAAIQPGTTRARVEQLTGPGNPVGAAVDDQLIHGVYYQACTPGDTFVVLYSNKTERVVSAIYAHA